VLGKYVEKQQVKKAKKNNTKFDRRPKFTFCR